MALTVANLEIKVSADTAAAEKGLTGLNQQVEKSPGIFGGASSAVKGFAGAVGGFAAIAAGSQIVSFFGDAIGAASELAETTSKVGIVFGDQEPAIRALGETAATSLGMSENAALSAAATFGNLFRAMELTPAVSADMSAGLVQVAADLASFNNMDPTEVLDKLRAGLSGETEPLRSLGVNLNAAAIEAKAFEMGLASSTAELTPAIKAQATYALIMEQTSLAQGDFARTSDGAANQQRILQAQLADVTAEIGQALLPIFTAFMGFLNDIGIPAIRLLIDVIGFVLAPIGALIDALGSAFAIAQEVVGNFAMDFGEQAERIKAIAESTGQTFQEVKDGIRVTMADQGLSFEEAATKAEMEFAREKSAAWQLYQDINSAAVEGWAAQEAASAGHYTTEQQAQIAHNAAMAAQARAAGYNNVVQFAAGLLDAQNEPKVAMDALAAAQTEAMDRQTEITYLKGLLTSSELAAGLNDNRPAVQLAAEAAQADIKDRLAQLGIDASTWGYNVSQNLAAGMRSGQFLVETAAGQVAGAIRGITAILSEPTDPRSPLRGITRWGGNAAKTIAEGMLGGVGVVRSASQAIARAMGPSVGFGFAAQPLPSFAGGGGISAPIHRPAPMPVRAMVGGGPTVHVHVQQVIGTRDQARFWSQEIASLVTQQLPD